MKHDRIGGLRKMANLSRAATSGQVVSHYDVILKFAHPLQGINLGLTIYIKRVLKDETEKPHMYLMLE